MKNLLVLKCNCKVRKEINSVNTVNEPIPNLLFPLYKTGQKKKKNSEKTVDFMALNQYKNAKNRYL